MQEVKKKQKEAGMNILYIRQVEATEQDEMTPANKANADRKPKRCQGVPRVIPGDRSEDVQRKKKSAAFRYLKAMQTYILLDPRLDGERSLE